MTVIAHEACPRCYRTADDVGSDEDGPGCGDYLNCPGTMTAFVPADQLKGAVETLQRIATPGEGPARALWRITMAQDWLKANGYPTTTGGQLGR
jgi:hypothetical protein